MREQRAHTSANACWVPRIRTLAKQKDPCNAGSLRRAEDGSQVSRLIDRLDSKPKRAGLRLEVGKARPPLPQDRAYTLRLRCERELAVKPAVEADGRYAGLPQAACQLLSEWIREQGWVNEDHFDTGILFDCPRKMADAFDDVLSRLGSAGVCLETLKIEIAGVARIGN